MIIGRNNELNQLGTYYNRDKSQIIVLYGQKYIGKTNTQCYFQLLENARKIKQLCKEKIMKFNKMDL